MDQAQQGPEQKKSYEPIPAGTYRVRMKSYKVEPTKTGNTKLSAVFEIMAGDHKKRVLFTDYVLTHPNPKAVAVTTDRLSSYLKAIGAKDGFKGDPSVLEGYIETPLNAEIFIEEDKTGKYKPRNKIKKFFAQ